jgi:tRNA1Val (adenine37-N6)-methyltransferase
MVLVESRRGGGVGLTIEAPLYVYDGDNYSAEVLSCYGEG